MQIFWSKTRCTQSCRCAWNPRKWGCFFKNACFWTVYTRPPLKFFFLTCSSVCTKFGCPRNLRKFAWQNRGLFAVLPFATREKQRVHGVCKFAPLFWRFSTRFRSEKSLIFSVQNLVFFARNLHEICTKFSENYEFHPLTLKNFLGGKVVGQTQRFPCYCASRKNFSVSPCHRFFAVFYAIFS